MSVDMPVALREAVEDDSPDALRQILEAGHGQPALKPTPEQLSRALSIACVYDLVENARLLLEHGAVITPSVLSAAHDEEGNSLAIWRLFLDSGWDPNQRVHRHGFHGGSHTPLHTAVDNVELLKLLVEHGADVNAEADDVVTGARHAGSVEPATTPLDWAVQSSSSLEPARFLLQRGARPGPYTLFWPFIRHSALAHDMIQLLIDAGAADMVNTVWKGRFGTVLHNAVTTRQDPEDRRAIVELLMDAGADPMIRTNFCGKGAVTALELAENRKDENPRLYAMMVEKLDARRTALKL